MKIHGFHEGDRSEYLALFAFSTIAYCSPVPRQFDRFGVDFFAHLAEKAGQNLVATGRAVCAQVKSDGDPVLLDTPELLGCLYDTVVPFFHVVIDKGGHTIRVYTTVDRIDAYYSQWFSRLWVIPGEKEQGKPKAVMEGDHFLYLGKPIYERPLAMLEDDAAKHEERARFLNVIASWAKWEQVQLGFKESTVPYFAKIKQYVTNEPLSLDSMARQRYLDPSYLVCYRLAVRAYLAAFHDYLEQLRDRKIETRVPDFAAKSQAVTSAIAGVQRVLEQLQPPDQS